MKKVIALSIGLLLLTSCEQDTSVSEIEGVNVDQSSLTRGAKVDICHKGRIKNVSVNALGGHQGHGDGADMDGDGYFDIANDCGETDCDDTTYSEDNTCGAAIGDLRDGGIVFWVDNTGQHGLVCAMNDAPAALKWGCYGLDLPNVPNVGSAPPSGLGAEIGDGFNNTTNILIDCPSSPAASYAISLGAGWFLPSIKELNEMDLNRAVINLTSEANGGAAFQSTVYWSSTEQSDNTVWLELFGGYQASNGKTFSGSVRAVRAF